MSTVLSRLMSGFIIVSLVFWVCIEMVNLDAVCSAFAATIFPAANFLAGGELILNDAVLRCSLTRFAVIVTKECLAIEISAIYALIVFAYPAYGHIKIAAIICGIALIQLVNMFRVVTLFIIGTLDSEVFGIVHDYLWPLLMLAIVLLYFRRFTLVNEDVRSRNDW